MEIYSNDDGFLKSPIANAYSKFNFTQILEEP